MDAESYRESAATLDRALKNKISENAVRRHISAVLGDNADQKLISQRSLYRYLLQSMAEAVSNHASQHATAFEFENSLNEALGVVETLRSNLVEDCRKNKSLDFWDFHGTPLDKIKAGKVPYFYRSGIESVVGDYLALPYRSQAMDCFLVRALIAMEFYAFGDEMLNEKTFGLFPARSPLKQRHSLLAYLGGQVSNLFFFGVIGAVAAWVHSARMDW